MNRIETVMTLGSAVAMGLVVGLHVPSLPGYWLCHWGVPWFFFASGFWFAHEEYSAGVRKRVRTLIAPYFLSNFIWFPILFAANWIGWRYCGVERIVDASGPCVVRCLGLSPFAWPALVPTWFLRALFVVVLVIGGLRHLIVICLSHGTSSNPLSTSHIRLSFFFAACVWIVYGTQSYWMPSGEFWRGFFIYGLSLSGCAWFSTGLAVSSWIANLRHSQLLAFHDALVASLYEPSSAFLSRFCALLRRQLMPIYMLHVVVIVSVGWVAKACGLFGGLTTFAGDVAMWFVGITGAILLGGFLRHHTPRFARLLFGGR